MTRAATQLLQKVWFGWIDRRIEPASAHRLHRRNLYVFPTRTGFLYLLLALLVWLLGSNYQNNLILALAYLQISLFIVVILHTYANLDGLQITLQTQPVGAARSPIPVTLQLRAASDAGADNVQVEFPRQRARVNICVDRDTPRKVTLRLPGERRGIGPLPRLRLESTYPLGLVRAWAWIRFDLPAVRYPTPLTGSDPGGRGETESAPSALVGGDDPGANLSIYREGMPVSRIAWKQYARGRGLLYRQPEATAEGVVDLHWEDFYRGDVELCLSNLAYLVLQLSEDGRRFALTLPDREVAAGEGADHRLAALAALAGHGGGATHAQ